MASMSRLVTMLPISVFALVTGQVEARAEEAPQGEVVAVEQPVLDAVEASFHRRPFFGAIGGIGFVAVNHPALATPRVYGPMLSIALGATISPRWSIGLQFTNMERVVSRPSGGVR